jgi:hypothetical protein
VEPGSCAPAREGAQRRHDDLWVVCDLGARGKGQAAEARGRRKRGEHDGPVRLALPRCDRSAEINGGDQRTPRMRRCR